MHSKYSGYNESKETENKKNKGFTLEKIKSLQKMIFDTISKWEKAHQYVNHWSSYYENDIESQEYLKDKEETVRKWLELIKPISVLDLGANTGKFSFIAAEYAERVISLEGDENCVDVIEKQIKKNNINNVFTLVGNVAEPTITIGLLNEGTESIYKRCESELTLGLALTHHLHISNKISFEQIANIFSTFTSRYLILEFIAKKDEKVIKLLSKNIKKRSTYDLKKLINCLNINFKLENKMIINDSRRILTLWIKK